MRLINSRFPPWYFYTNLCQKMKFLCISVQCTIRSAVSLCHYVAIVWLCNYSIYEFITGLHYVRIGALCMLCMSRYVVHILGVQEIEVIRVQRLCYVSSIQNIVLFLPGCTPFFFTLNMLITILSLDFYRERKICIS